MNGYLLDNPYLNGTSNYSAPWLSSSKLAILTRKIEINYFALNFIKNTVYKAPVTVELLTVVTLGC